MKSDFMVKLRTLLEQSLETTQLNIEDDSAAHAGHGATGGHYNIQIASPHFEGKTAIQCHRLINQAVQKEFQNGVIHALSIQVIR